MELNKFITETIVQISKGISGAQEELKGANCLVNPKNVSIHNNGDKFLVNKRDGTRISVVQDIEVIVAITEMIQEGGRAGIGVVAGIFGAGSEQSSNNSNQVVSTVKFNIPIVLPTVDTPEGFIEKRKISSNVF